MRSILCVAVVAAWSVVGCQNKKPAPPMPDPVPSADFVERVRTDYKKTNPDVRVGVIDTVLTDAPYLSAKDIDTTGLKIDDVVSVIDGTEKLLAHGIVRAVAEGRVSVQFSVAPGGRTPKVGDVVVKF